jgi:putative thiamine transport system substrate-binding protein
MSLTRRRLAVLAACAALPARAQPTAWDGIAARARGQTVAFDAWAGDEPTNAYIAWAAERVQTIYGITLRHVRLRDTGEAVARVVAERAAGRDSGGAVDLIWINGPNFLALKQQGFLMRFAEGLPNFALVDTVGKPATVVDFTVPVDGLAAPWRMAQIVFIHDSARQPSPPRTMGAMAGWAAANRGRLAHPTARNFLGATFLKQALHELAPDPAVLQQPATDAGFAPAAAPLWGWYDALRPNLWHGGRQFPENGPATRNLLNDGEIDLMVSFNPAEAATGIAAGLLPASARAYVLDGGTISNASFVAIPANASAPEGAQVVADFLLSPAAQARAQDLRGMGNPTVLDLARLQPEDRALFDALPRAPGMLTAAELGHPLQEPHPTWMTRITAEWERRTGGG